MTVCKDDCYLLDSARGVVYADACQDSISSACRACANSSTRYRSALAGRWKVLSTCLLPPGTFHQSRQPAFKHREIVACELAGTFNQGSMYFGQIYLTISVERAFSTL